MGVLKTTILAPFLAPPARTARGQALPPLLDLAELPIAQEVCVG